ncbi:MULTISPECIES: ion transporter [unclassified Brevundimonas]|uniref:ion transporter n=1 Tax=unclassified Brevundimonas TaxID=2622653 RepID=UPI000C5D1535|nr:MULTISPECIES: ion transporter [unclassified Brevundimonas]MAL87485.1 voltage-gated sodium channel [Brevundimonas sp.]
MDRLRQIVTSPRTERFILALIILNAITLGLETSSWVMDRIGPVLLVLDKIVLAIFVVEVVARIAVHRLAFFKDPWSLFDFGVVAIALVPAAGPFSVLRALRILRVLRMITIVPSLKRVVGALISALPGMGSIVLLMGLIFYVASVMATKLFGADFPQWFGSIPASAYSLFQIMTLESWSMGIVRPVMEVHPYAWMFFVPFILCTTFTMLNLFIGIVVNAMQAEHEEEAKAERHKLEEDLRLASEERQKAHAEDVADMAALRGELAELRQAMTDLTTSLTRRPG